MSADLRCRRLLFPDIEGLAAAVGGALSLLGEEQNWQQFGTMTPEVAAQHMRNMLATWYESDNCAAPLPDESGEVLYTPDAALISYAPQDPFQQPDLTPPGYALPPFYHNPLIPLPGVLPGDAMVNFVALPIFANIVDILTSGFPRLRIRVNGTGRLILELVQVPQGGLVLLTIDGSAVGGSLIDLSYASVFDPALFESIFDIVIDGVNDNVILHELEITTPGAHYIDVTFLPVVDSVSVLGFGGGIRSVRVSGFDSVGTWPMPQFQLSGDDLEWRPNEAAAWSNLGNVRGATGAQGPQGEQGEQGPQGIPGADGLPGADGECPDCPPPPPAGADLCRFAWATVNGMWFEVDALLNDLIAYKSANPSDTYIDASDAVFPGLGFAVGEQAVLTNFIQSMWDGDGLTAFQTMQSAALETLACALFQNLTTDFISDIVLSDWFDCLAPIVTEPTEWMLLMPTLNQFRAWATSNYASTAPHDCSECDECGSCGTGCYTWTKSELEADWTFDFGANGSLSSYCHISGAVDILSIEFTWTWNGIGGGAGGTGNGVGSYCNASYSCLNRFDNYLSSQVSPYVWNAPGGVPVSCPTGIALGGNAEAGGAGRITIQSITVTYGGCKPEAWVSGSDC